MEVEMTVYSIDATEKAYSDILELCHFSRQALNAWLANEKFVDEMNNKYGAGWLLETDPTTIAGELKKAEEILTLEISSGLFHYADNFANHTIHPSLTPEGVKQQEWKKLTRNFFFNLIKASTNIYFNGTEEFTVDKLVGLGSNAKWINLIINQKWCVSEFFNEDNTHFVQLRNDADDIILCKGFSNTFSISELITWDNIRI